MPMTRRFLIAPPLARLVHKEFAPARVTEGHFAPHAERHTHVRLDSGQASLARWFDKMLAYAGTCVAGCFCGSAF